MDYTTEGREVVWSKLTAALGAAAPDSRGQRPEVVIVHDGQRVLLDFDRHAGYRSEDVHTRFRAPLRRSPLRLRVFHQELVHSVGRLLGMQDIRVGDEAFDATFVVQGTDPGAIARLFKDASVRKLMLEEPELEITLDASRGVAYEEDGPEADELTLEVPGEIEDQARLRRLFDLFTHVLHALRPAS